MSFFDFSLKAKAERPVVPAVDRVAKVPKDRVGRTEVT